MLLRLRPATRIGSEAKGAAAGRRTVERQVGALAACGRARGGAASNEYFLACTLRTYTHANGGRESERARARAFTHLHVCAWHVTFLDENRTASAWTKACL